jgi:hypothetical protein
VLRRLEDLDQGLTLGVDVGDVSRQYAFIANRVAPGLDMVGADGLDYLVVVAVARLLGGAGGAQETVRGAFELGVVAARGADNGRAVVLEAGSALCEWCIVEKLVVSRLLHNAGYILRKLAHARAAKLEHHPAAGKVLFFRVRYPLRRVLVSVECGGHAAGFFLCRSSDGWYILLEIRWLVQGGNNVIRLSEVIREVSVKRDVSLQSTKCAGPESN